jgi:hypothetical protein
MCRAIELDTGDDEGKKRRQVIEQLFLIECAAAYLDDAFNVRFRFAVSCHYC